MRRKGVVGDATHPTWVMNKGRGRGEATVTAVDEGSIETSDRAARYQAD